MKSALGRGLGELLGEIDNAYDNENNISTASIEEIDIDLIIPNPNQPRTVFNEAHIEELSLSIKEHGLLQPINVTRDGSNYILIAGERRLRASKLANLRTIKAIVINVDDSKLAELALIENIQREDLNIVELANSYNKLLNDYNLTHDELSKKVSKSRSSITNTLRLLKLSTYVQNKLSENAITLGHAKMMIGLDDLNQKKLTDSIIGQKLSVRETEETIKQLKNNTPKVEKNKTNTYNLDNLNEVIFQLNNQNIKVSLTNNSLKINFNSQDDIDTISKYFIK
jgi:ParB family chromosome partitioning protein